MKKVISFLLILILSIGNVGCTLLGVNISLPDNDIQNEESQMEKPGPQNYDDGTTDIDVNTDSGRYMGQADSNFIEIKISGVPDEMDPVVFMLSDEIKKIFASLELETEDNVKIEYFINEHDQKVIVKIEKI